MNQYILPLFYGIFLTLTVAMENNILQWNCRSIKANFEELNLLLNEQKPVAVCLQETFLKDSDKFNLKYHSCYFKNCSDKDKASGGVAVIVNNFVPHHSLRLDSTLQAVAVSISLNKTITLCSVYLPPRLQIDIEKLDHLIDQLPKPFILMGDFNSHHSLWGCTDTNDKGRTIEGFITKHDLVLLNDKSSTYLHPATGSYSSLDLTICSPGIFPNFNWKVVDDLHGSDHFPIQVSEVGPSVQQRPQRWKLHKADWEQFRVQCEQSIHPNVFDDCESPAELFSSLLYSAAEKSIPRTSTDPKHPNKPWFSDDCKKAIAERKSVLRQFNLRPTQENLSKFKIARAKARRTIKQNKRTSWRQYVSRLNSRSSVKKTWEMIRKINGKNSTLNVGHLNVDDDVVTSKADIADVLADVFAEKSSSSNYSTSFQKFQNSKEKTKLNFKSNNDEHYNKDFTIKELRKALKKCHDTAVGSDDIHYQFLKHLPFRSLDSLLRIFNQIWHTGILPDSWKEAIVIPIPKPGKDSTNPANYRPIALTSCICKTMERMVNDRLVWVLEKNKLIAAVQSGFRKQRGTLDHLVRFETFIREAFIKKEHVVSVFFYLESAYDTTWKYGIMNDLHDFGIRGRLAYFISAFLNERQFRVRVGDTLSNPHEQEMGVPQGSILSVTLFSVKINNIVKSVCPGVECFLYVDDFCICYRSKHMHTIERQLQQVLNKLSKWSSENGFKFSKSKTKCMHFCQSRKLHLDPELTLDGVQIEVVPELKFLGLLFDSKLSFIPHINYLSNKCQKALNLLRVVSSMDWGADRKVLLRLYRTLVRSKLDYGCIVYGSARQSYLRNLDSIHNQGLRLALGAFKTSPVNSLYVEANEPSLNLRRKKLSLQYYLKLKANRENPTYKAVFEPLYKDEFIQKDRIIPPFSLRCEADMNCIDIDLEDVANHKISEVPLWTCKSPTYNYYLASDKKATTDPMIFKNKFLEIKEKYYTHEEIYTDGSKDGKKVASAAILDGELYQFRLPNNSSVFSAEIKAIDLALNHIEQDAYWRYVIYTDSLSAMKALEGEKTDNPLVVNLLEKLSRLCERADIVFCWLPSHIGISGNEEADKAAKDALSLEVLSFKVPYNDFKPLINDFLRNVWQQSWSDPANQNNKLFTIKPSLGEWLPGLRTNRREEIIIARLRIGHSYITHSYLLKGEEEPQCIPCNALLTIKHILVDCVDLAPIRQRFFDVDSLTTLFDTVKFESIFDFLKETHLYKKI